MMDGGELDARVAAMAARARVAARLLAPLPRSERTPPSSPSPTAFALARGARLAANEHDVDAARARGDDRAMLDRLALDAKAPRRDGGARRGDCGAPRPWRRRALGTERPNGICVSARARAARGHRDDLRGAPQRDGRRERALPQGGQRRRPARRLGGGALERRARGGGARRARRDAGLPARRGPGGPPRTERDGDPRARAADGTVDLAIPRGGEALIRFVREHARVPVIAALQGRLPPLRRRGGRRRDGRAARGERQALSAPACATRSSACSSTRADAARLLPPVARASCGRLRAARRRARRARSCRRRSPRPTTTGGSEFLAPILAVRVVDGLDGALAHIARYGSSHTEAICTRGRGPRRAVAPRGGRGLRPGQRVARASTTAASSAWAPRSASRRASCTGAAPMGLEALTTFKWVVDGDGQIAAIGAADGAAEHAADRSRRGDYAIGDHEDEREQVGGDEAGGGGGGERHEDRSSQTARTRRPRRAARGCAAPGRPRRTAAARAHGHDGPRRGRRRAPDARRPSGPTPKAARPAHAEGTAAAEPRPRRRVASDAARELAVAIAVGRDRQEGRRPRDPRCRGEGRLRRLPGHHDGPERPPRAGARAGDRGGAPRRRACGPSRSRGCRTGAGCSWTSATSWSTSSRTRPGSSTTSKASGSTRAASRCRFPKGFVPSRLRSSRRRRAIPTE